jgi:putative nucleotidyltransferase with HDIG domain
MAAAAATATNPEMQQRLSDQLEAILGRRIANDQLMLPSLPAAAVKCLTLLKNPEFSLREAAAIIETDPILAARLLKLANSAAFGGRDSSKTITAAVTRLGLQKLRAFLVEASASKVFESNDRRIAEASRTLWTHSVAVAVVARDVTALCGGGDPELAYLGGLLHDVGKPVVAAMLLDAERATLEAKKHALWINGADWIAVVQRIHRRVGVALVERWEMPQPVRNAVRDCEEYDNSDRLSVANVVRFANAVVKQRGIYIGPVNVDDNDAMVMIGRSLLNLDDEMVERATAGLGKLGGMV